MKLFSTTKIETILNYNFKNKDLLEQAFTRSSWAEENNSYISNEVLEFVGDKVLDYIIVKRLISRYGNLETEIRLEKDENGKTLEDQNGKPVFKYKKQYFDTGEYDEGRLSKVKSRLVCCNSLASAIDSLELSQYLIMSNGDIKNGVQNEAHVKEDLFESIVGAVAIDSGWDMTALEKLVDHMLDPDEKLENGLSDDDFTGMFQSWYQKNHNGALPEYEITGADGGYKAEIKNFGSMLTGVFCGKGRSKKEACSEASREAWSYVVELENSRKKTEEQYNAVGKPEYDRAVNQLQELWQKGYISKPVYKFSKSVKEEDGSDLWECICEIENYGGFGGYGSTKTEAKKDAAYFAVQNI